MLTDLETALLHYQTASTAQQHGHFARAEAEYLVCIALFRQIEGESSTNLANLHNALALAREQAGDCDAALEAARQAHQIMASLPAAQDEEADLVRLQTWTIIGSLQRRLARHAVAEHWLTRALEHAVARFGAASAEAAAARHTLDSFHQTIYPTSAIRELPRATVW